MTISSNVQHVFRKFAVYIIILSLVILCIPIGLWLLSHPQPLDGYSLKDISMTSSTNGWAVGEKSESPSFLIMHYTNQNWHLYHDAHSQIDPSTLLSSVQMVSSSEGWAVGSVNIKDTKSKYGGFRIGGIILHYTNDTWMTDKLVTSNTPLLSVRFRNPSDGWAVGYGGLLLHYDGKSWNTILIPSIDQYNFTKVFVSGTDVWCAGYDVLLHYDGKLWVRNALPNGAIIQSLAMISPGYGWAIINFTSDSSPDYSGIWKDTNDQWTKIGPSDLQNVTDISVNTQGDGWIVGTNGSIIHFTQNDLSRFQSPTRNNLRAVSVNTPNDAWAVGDFGTILHYHEGAWNIVPFHL